jgi:hypothetical protein
VDGGAQVGTSNVHPFGCLILLNEFCQKISLLRQLLMQTPNALQPTIKPSSSIIPKNQKAQHNNAIFLSVKISELTYINDVLHDCP